jgi:creatinine amidohydrolase
MMNPDKAVGINLEHLSWIDAEEALKSVKVVVIPLGGQLKEHGPHLPLNNDWVMAEYLKNRVLAALPVAITPTVNYSYYPAMVEYPGTVSLRYDTARDIIIDICDSFARFGISRFYCLNTGISTLKPLEQASEQLSERQLVLSYSNLRILLDGIKDSLEQQEGGTHADEIETSMMLFIAPEIVDMTKAKKDYSGPGPGPLTRKANSKGTYSPTGAWGDPTLASRDKGETLVEHLVSGIISDITKLMNG